MIPYLHRKGSELRFNATHFSDNCADVDILVQNDLTYQPLVRKHFVAEIQMRDMASLKHQMQ